MRQAVHACAAVRASVLHVHGAHRCMRRMHRCMRRRPPQGKRPVTCSVTESTRSVTCSVTCSVTRSVTRSVGGSDWQVDGGDMYMWHVHVMCVHPFGQLLGLAGGRWGAFPVVRRRCLPTRLG